MRRLNGGRRIHGDDLLYRFFRDALANHPEIFAKVPQLLITSMGVWLPLDLYKRMPVVLPWVVRDPSCRGSRSRGIPDAWSSPNARGYMRDDNTMIKNIPKALRIDGPESSHVRGTRMGKEFVAAHVWRQVDHADLASRVPLLNSFAPNLVWLPSQVAKLTDLEGGVVQRTLQAMSHRIYRRAPVAEYVADRAEAAWDLIPEPEVEIEGFTAEDLNWFAATPVFAETRLERLDTVIAALNGLAANRPLPERVVTSRYASGLPNVDEAARENLRAFLAGFQPPPVA